MLHVLRLPVWPLDPLLLLEGVEFELLTLVVLVVLAVLLVGVESLGFVILVWFAVQQVALSSVLVIRPDVKPAFWIRQPGILKLPWLVRLLP